MRDHEGAGKVTDLGQFLSGRFYFPSGGAGLRSRHGRWGRAGGTAAAPAANKSIWGDGAASRRGLGGKILSGGTTEGAGGAGGAVSVVVASSCGGG